MKNRLQQIISKEGISALKFAEIIEVQRSTVSHILSGRNNPGLEFIQKTLNNFPQINTDWFITGRGEMYKKTASSSGDEIIKPQQADPDLFSVLKDEEQASYHAASSINSDKDGVGVRIRDRNEDGDGDITTDKEETIKTKETEPDISDLQKNTGGPERIVIFYKNGSFKEYLPHKQ